MSSACPIVETKLGRVKGRLLQTQSNGKQVYNYTSIPFAKPPVGQLRFEPPAEPEPWDGVLNGSLNPAKPYQELEYVKFLDNYHFFNNELDFEKDNMSEDCLYLSVYTTNPSKSANLPVVFWIYGGGFMLGSQCSYNAKILSSLNNVVVVIPNYRVGALGFFNMGRESNYRGNMGLLDQVQALKWTRDHVRAFGGNPQNVTIMGESAGGISVSYHMLSPLSRGFFQRAVSNSGTAILGDIMEKDPTVVWPLFLEALKITDDNPAAIIAKLKALPVEEIHKVQMEIAKTKMASFTPCVDGNFLPDGYLKLLEEGKTAPVPLIIGCNNTENLGVMGAFQPGFADGFSEEVCTSMLKQHLGLLLKAEVSDAALERLKKKYSSGLSKTDKHKWSKVFGNVLSDVSFVNPALATASYHAKANHPTYFYQMTQALTCFHDTHYGEPTMMKAPFCECDHGDDILFTFGVPLDEGKLTKDVKFTDGEKQLSKEWMAYITNFAKTGNPNSGASVMREWPLYSADGQKYLSVQQPCAVKKSLNADRFQLWKEIMPSLKKQSS